MLSTRRNALSTRRRWQKEKEKSSKRKTYISEKRQKGGFSALAAIGAQIGSQVIGGLIIIIF